MLLDGAQASNRVCRTAWSSTTPVRCCNTFCLAVCVSDARYGRCCVYLCSFVADSSLVPLLVQENYLSTRADLDAWYAHTHTQYTGFVAYQSSVLSLVLVVLLCCDHCSMAAAQSISDGDLIDNAARRGAGGWTLMPAHAVLSTARPASIIGGT